MSYRHEDYIPAHALPPPASKPAGTPAPRAHKLPDITLPMLETLRNAFDDGHGRVKGGLRRALIKRGLAEIASDTQKAIRGLIFFRCPRCGCTEHEDNFDLLDAKEGNVFCPDCSTEFESKDLPNICVITEAGKLLIRTQYDALKQVLSEARI